MHTEEMLLTVMIGVLSIRLDVLIIAAVHIIWLIARWVMNRTARIERNQRRHHESDNRFMQAHRIER